MPTVLRALALLSALAASEAYTVSQQSDLGRLLDYTPDYTALKVAGVEHSYNAPADTCEALSGTGEARANMTKWCKKNCGFDPPNCPATLCMCGDAGEKATAQKENLGGSRGCTAVKGAEGVSDKWCVTNCEVSMLNCPEELCDCPNREAATKRDLEAAAPTTVPPPKPVPAPKPAVAPTPMAVPAVPPTVVAQPVDPQKSKEAAAEAQAKIAADAAAVAAEAAEKEAKDAEAAAAAQQKRDDENAARFADIERAREDQPNPDPNPSPNRYPNSEP